MASISTDHHLDEYGHPYHVDEFGDHVYSYVASSVGITVCLNPHADGLSKTDHTTSAAGAPVTTAPGSREESAREYADGQLASAVEEAKSLWQGDYDEALEEGSHPGRANRSTRQRTQRTPGVQ